MKIYLQSLTGLPRLRAGRAACAFACAMMLFMGASESPARSDDAGIRTIETGGFSGPGPAIVTVDQLKGMRDDAKVTLRGNIIQSLGGKEYLFKDATGTVPVEIGDNRWRGQKVDPDDIVEIHGELDKDWSKMEIDVKRLIKQ